jgi:hypothetical protein
MQSRVTDFFVKSTALFLAIFWSGQVLAVQEKICDNERAIFQCEVRGGKNLALCPNYVDGELTGIQYRFGREENKELVFPLSGFDFKKFRSNHFVRYQVDYKRVKFLNGSYLYSIYSNYDGANIGEVSRDAGIIISNSSETPEIQISCAHIYIDNLKELIPYIACDANDALGCMPK